MMMMTMREVSLVSFSRRLIGLNALLKEEERRFRFARCFSFYFQSARVLMFVSVF